MRHYPRWIGLLLTSALVAFVGSGCTKEVRARRHLVRADRCFSSQNYDEAEIEYLKVLQVSPLDSLSIRQLGTIYQRQGKWARAYAFLKKAVELNPEDVPAHVQLSLTYLSLQERKLASQEAIWVLKKQPGQEEALSVLVDSSSSPKEFQQAQSEIEKSRQADKDRAAYHLAIGTLDLKQLDFTNAESEARRALVIEPDSAAAKMSLGNLYWIRADLTNAESAFKSAADLSPLRSPRRLRYAEFKLQTGAVDAAKASLREITEKAPDYLPAWNLLAEISLGQKNFSDCKNALDRVLARNATDFTALLLMGNLKLAMGDTAQAVATFERMAAMYDRAPQVDLQLAHAYLMNGDTGKAVPKLNHAIATDPNFSAAILLLAQINMRKGETLESISALKDLLKRQPQLPQAYLLLANAYLMQKDPEQAVSVCRQMEARFPKSPEVLLVLGSVLERQNQPGEARRSFEQALELSPDFLPALEQIVDLDLANKQFAVAIDRVTNQIERHADAGEPWLLLAKVHMTKAESFVPAIASGSQAQPHSKSSLAEIPAAQEDVNKAESALLKSIELNPDLRNAYFMLANLYVSCNKQVQALERLNSFLAKTNDVVARTQVGILQDRLKNFSAARDAYEKVLALDANSSIALNNLAYLYSEHFADLDKAYQLAEKARRLRPNDPSTADTLGWILFKRGEYSRALGIIDESAAKLPTNPEIQFHLGMAHYMLVEEGPAQLALEQACQSPNDFVGKEEARRRLGVLAIDAKLANAATVSDLKKYLRDTPADPVALCRLGAVQTRDGAIDEAVHSYEGALKCSPQNPQILLKLAQLYASSGSPGTAKAMEITKTAHNLAPDDPRISALLGSLAFETGDSKWSASLLEDSARRLPLDANVAYDLAWAYYSLGRVTDAETAMRRAQASSENARAEKIKTFLTFVAASHDASTAEGLSEPAKTTLVGNPAYVPALAVAALVQEQHRNFSEAAHMYERILAVYPNFTPATRSLAILYSQRLGEDAKAYDLAVKARETFPQDGEIGGVLGVLEYRKGNYRRAAQLLRDSSRQRQDDAELFYYLGLTQYQLKQMPESRAALERSLALNVQPKFAEAAKRVLLELKR